MFLTRHLILVEQKTSHSVNFINKTKSVGYRRQGRLTWYGTGLLYYSFANILRPNGLVGSKIIEKRLRKACFLMSEIPSLGVSFNFSFAYFPMCFLVLFLSYS